MNNKITSHVKPPSLRIVKINKNNYPRNMIGLKLLRFLLPPFHHLKYKYINWWYGSQSNLGGWKGWKESNATEMKEL